MASQTFVDPVDGDAVPKVDNAVAIGEDLAFQERWWKFEHLIWSFFALVLLADVLGVFGRGWLARSELRDPATGMHVKYERVERASTPSIMDITFAPETVSDGAVHLFVSESIVKELGTQRVAPQPVSSVIGHGGITYAFAAAGSEPVEVQLALEPSFPGVHRFTLQVPGRSAAEGHVVVMP